ncbi:MAG TPA: NAD(P)H-binding protein [Actinomycetota bacterium]|nr:NAD(P)H-binding protein [Actinomycetota bacterium]
MKIAVAGGTGFLGRHITQTLVAGGHEVSVLTRDPDKMTAIPQLAGCAGERVDVTEPSSLFGKLTGFDAVVMAVQLPNYPVEQPRKGLTFDRYDRQGTEHLLREATNSGVRRFAYISGAGADPASEKTWYRAKGFAEVAIRRSGISHFILRPSWAYGPEDKALNKFVAIARLSPIVPKPGVRPQRIQPVFVEDIAKAVCRAFEVEAAWGETFEIGGPDVMTMDEVIRTLLEVMGKKRFVLPVPAPLMKVATAPLLLLPKPPLTPAAVDFATQDGVVDARSLETMLDVHPIGLREGLERYISA